MSHTPGPWHYQEETGTDGELCFYSIRDQNENYISSTWSEPHAGNAHLIAAAPELLEALKTIFEELEGGVDAPGHAHRELGKWDSDGADCKWCADWAKARLALAKAEGK